MSRWGRYGDFPQGLYGLPHMGSVIAAYRKKYGCDTQQELAIVAGVDKQTVNYWETNMYLADMERRIFLQKLLKIPPVLLGLTLYSVVEDENAQEYNDSQERMAELIAEDSFYNYEDVLAMGWVCMYSGGSADIAYRVNRRLQKLINIAVNAPSTDREAWLGMLCNFYQLSTRFAQKNTDLSKALADSSEAVKIARNLEDVELIAASHFRRIRVHMEQKNYKLAREDAKIALECAKRVRNPLQGNIYLIAAEVEALWSAEDMEIQKHIRGWQDKVLNTLYKNNKIEEDGSFLKLNLAAVHHERAKTLIQFYQNNHKQAKMPTFSTKQNKLLEDAQNEMTIAWKMLDPDLLSWHVNFHVTDAKYSQAKNDVEGSVQSAKKALKIARSMNAKNGAQQIKQLYHALENVDPKNPYIRNLGVELGIF
ncbi:helix-turn-helix transcriptional regulator [Tengunoibacter tsumagoiensis]|uniref:HTH cro/C1-type domain-containing protein n=1 Tax=Tengunoibacter tsumagoiensis TaxID=2014871 RepID=A0A401ZUW2_9CHLR|nr:helix-turn-helix transcriptional regulator [Tengunoibacter tsumagoiensis]GCE10627.1 hypothetical protein KTT_04860 [Tengunoibacter tsumagoiensis]